VLRQRVHHVSGLETNYPHHYLRPAATPEKCSTKWLRELSYISDNLPEEVTLYVSEEHPNYLIVSMTIANTDCPYFGGFFVFHVMVPSDYPLRSPLVNLMTTGGGQVRFNPNLYPCGKVCLSLLGTWAGEPWNPKTSNMTQVLKSILYLIFTEQPYYNEPGYDNYRGSEASEQLSLQYDSDVFKNTIQSAIEGHASQLATYPAPVQDVIRAYYQVHWEHGMKTALASKLHTVYPKFLAGLGGKLRGKMDVMSRHVQAWQAAGHVAANGTEEDNSWREKPKS
jgi:ubiquitin-protein ligase